MPIQETIFCDDCPGKFWDGETCTDAEGVCRYIYNASKPCPVCGDIRKLLSGLEKEVLLNIPSWESVAINGQRIVDSYAAETVSRLKSIREQIKS